jgi:hypothetical protein
MSSMHASLGSSQKVQSEPGPVSPLVESTPVVAPEPVSESLAAAVLVLASAAVSVADAAPPVEARSPPSSAEEGAHAATATSSEYSARWKATDA